MAKAKKTQLCASGEKGCVKPNGTVVWVFCEACQQWYHCPCANVDSKKANDDDFIFICKPCKPQKEKEFNAVKNQLKRDLGVVMDRHPVFSTALIARRCFASKSASNEYHFGRPGIPVTLRELEEKMMRDVSSVDHFKHMAKVMAERMVSSVKGEFIGEAKSIQGEMDKLIKSLNGGNKASNKKGSNKENDAAAAANDEQQPEAPATPKKSAPAKQDKEQPSKPTRESKRGKAAAAATQVAPSAPEEKQPARKKATKKEAAVKKTVEEAPPKVSSPEPVAAVDSNVSSDVKCAMCSSDLEAPVYQCLEFHVTCHPCFQKAVRGYCPVCQKSKRNRRTKKYESLDAVQKRKNSTAASSDADISSKIKSDAKDAAAPPSGPTAAAGRKRKNALATVNSNRGAKVQKTAAIKDPTTVVAAKIITGSPGSPAKIAIASGSNMVNLSALSQPLPPQVVLPSSPLAAPQVQNLKASTGPPPQLIQLKPTSMNAATMQIRPVRPGTTLATATGPRPQFFKIVGGKPVQISASSLSRLPAGALTSLQGPGGPIPPGSRVMYMRAPGPASSIPGTITAVGSTVSTAALTSAGVVTAAGSPQGNKIILLSNKGQAIPVNSKGGGLPAPPSIVRIVSPTGAGAGGKITMAPGSPTKLTAFRPAGSSTPILLRTVAPKIVPGSGAPPQIQLPMAPLPKSALSSANGAADKKVNDASAKAIQVLLPKSPLPPATVGNTVIKSPGGTTTTTTSPPSASGAFVWTNSTRANFKLSSRINFASLDKFKNVVNKDVHFILANIVTEDKSNEFSFKLHLKREPAADSSSGASAQKGKGKKDDKKSIVVKADDEKAVLASYLELEAKAKVPTAQEWSLKVKTEPPVFLVEGGNFLSDFPPVRIPKEIAEKPFVDYELHIDKCSPTQVATGKGSVAKAAAAAAASAGGPPPAKRGRKVAAK